MRRLQLLVAGVLFVDTTFYAAVTPLLPYDVRHLGVPAGSVGLVVGGYAAGTLAGALPSGALVGRFGPRATVALGVVLTGAATVSFGLAHSLAALVASRVAEGVGGTCSWTGALAWLAVAAPPERRGAVLGRAYGAAAAGSLLGPALGGVAAAVGPARAFGGAGLIAAVLAVAALGLPAPLGRAPLRLRALAPALRDPGVAAGLVLVAVAGLGLATVDVLAPLRLAARHATAVQIAGVFVLAAGAQAVVSAWVGRRSDRSGRRRPLLGCLAAATVVCGVAAARLPLVALVLVVLAAAPAIGSLFVPATALVADGADRTGLSQGLAAAGLNLCWATGAATGAVSGSALATAVSPAAPWLLVAGMCLAAWLAIRLVRRPAGQL